MQETKRDVGLFPGSGRYTGGVQGNPLQISCQEHPMDRGASRATVHRVTKNWTQLKRLSMHTWYISLSMKNSWKWMILLSIFSLNFFHQWHCRNSSVVAQSCPTLCDPVDCSLPGSSPGDSVGKNTGVDSRSLLQGIFSTQGSNPCLLICQQILYCLSTREAHDFHKMDGRKN